jgi:hypothetical protein
MKLKVFGNREILQHIIIEQINKNCIGLYINTNIDNPKIAGTVYTFPYSDNDKDIDDINLKLFHINLQQNDRIGVLITLIPQTKEEKEIIAGTHIISETFSERHVSFFFMAENMIKILMTKEFKNE